MKVFLATLMILSPTPLCAGSISTNEAEYYMAVACTIELFCPDESTRTEVDKEFYAMKKYAQTIVKKECHINVDNFDPIANLIDGYKAMLKPNEKTCLSRVKY